MTKDNSAIIQDLQAFTIKRKVWHCPLHGDTVDVMVIYYDGGERGGVYCTHCLDSLLRDRIGSLEEVL